MPAFTDHTSREVMQLIGFLLSILAGAAMSVQGVMNTRLSERVGLYGSNAFVQGTAFLLSLIALWIAGKGNLRELPNVNKIYYLGGVIGLVITLSVIIGIKQLGPTLAVSAILIAQLFVAALIDAFGLLGADKVPFHVGKYIGLGLMIAGIIVFKRDWNT